MSEIKKQLAISMALIAVVVVFASCDMRSGTAKDEMGKWQSTPSAPISPTATPTPVDPLEIVTVDTKMEGDLISANGLGQKTTTACTKFNRLLVNGDDGVINVKGACRQIMVNGDKNKINADAAMEFVLNGTGNSIKYSRFVNGKAPSVVENKTGNVIEKVAADSVTSDKPQRKISK